VALRITRAASHKSQPTFCHKKVYLLSEPEFSELMNFQNIRGGRIRLPLSEPGYCSNNHSVNPANSVNSGSDNYSENSGQISQFTPQQGEKQ
jgi:hypothetical protein